MPWIDVSARQVHALGLLAPSHRARFSQHVVQALVCWGVGWGLDVEVSDRPSLTTQPLTWHRLANTQAACWLAWLEDNTHPPRLPAEVLGRLLWGMSPHDDGLITMRPDSWWLGTGADAWSALQHTLAEACVGWVVDGREEAPASSVTTAAVSPSEPIWTRHSDVWLTIRKPGGRPERVRLRADLQTHAATNAALPQEAFQRPSSHHRAAYLTDALAHHSLHLQAQLRPIPLTLGNWLSLGVGDVLRTAQPLQQALELSVPLAVPQTCTTPSLTPRMGVFEGHLVCQDTHLALWISRTVSSPSSAPTSQAHAVHVMTSSQEPSAGDLVRLLDIPPAPASATPGAPLTPSLQPLLHVPIVLEVRVGQASLTVQDLTSARIGQVLRLDTPVEGLVDLLLNGQVVGRGRLVAVDDDFGIQLAELPPALAPGMSAPT